MTVKEELEMLAVDCEVAAKEAMKIIGAESTTYCGEARAWLSVAYRIRHAAKRVSE